MFTKIFRIVFTLCGLLFGYGVALLINKFLMVSNLSTALGMSHSEELVMSVAFILLSGIIFFKLAPFVRKHGVKVARGIESDLAKVPTNDMVAGIIGLIIGLIIAFFISQILYSITVLNVAYINTILSVISYLFLGYLGMSVAQKKSKDVPAYQWMTTSKKQSKGKGKGNDASPKILDTSVIIDGRIADIMKTGFIEGNIVIPEFVLVELRHIADSSDSLKRNRGRRGLDILNRIQNDYGIDIYNTNSEKSLDEIPEVDVKLLKLAQIMNGKVVTNDFNLNKVAMIKGVEVLNINELANTLKPVVLPGEDMQLFLVKEGKENNQAVAYLDDGTMIVVEEGKRYIGKTIDVTVTSVLQTSAGRMIFAKPKR
ncbi:MAG: PIN domain-containing protein [Anaerovorax sp.]|nr:PIN domain-containing protein [Anaerovorax sp.]